MHGDMLALQIATRQPLDDEMLRDNALAMSGLLVENPAGPSVRPYQTADMGMYATYYSNMAYQQGHGLLLYRHSLYTFWKRQSPP